MFLSFIWLHDIDDGLKGLCFALLHFDVDDWLKVLCVVECRAWTGRILTVLVSCGHGICWILTFVIEICKW